MIWFIVYFMFFVVKGSDSNASSYFLFSKQKMRVKYEKSLELNSIKIILIKLIVNEIRILNE